MGKAVSIPISDSSPPQGERIVCVLRFTIPPPQNFAPIAIATDAAGNIMAQAVPFADGHHRGWLVRERASGPIPRYRDSGNVYPTQGAAEDAYWADASARVYRELERIAWEPWTEVVQAAE